MRLALIAAILFLGLTIANVVAFRRDQRWADNPYASAATVGSAIASAAAIDHPHRRVRENAWLREAGIAVAVAALWGGVALLGRRRRDAESKPAEAIRR